MSIMKFMSMVRESIQSVIYNQYIKVLDRRLIMINFLGGFFVKKFVKMIQRIYNERSSILLSRLMKEKTSVVLFSVSLSENIIGVAKNLKNQGLNIKYIITATPPPSRAFGIRI